MLNVIIDVEAIARMVCEFSNIELQEAVGGFAGIQIEQKDKFDEIYGLMKDLTIANKKLHRGFPGQTVLLDNGGRVLDDMWDIQILLRLILRLSERRQPTLSGRFPGPLRIATDLMERRFQENLTLDEIAEAAATSKSHLCRAFKKHTGMTVFDCLSQIRIRHAFRLLSDPSLNVSDVAYRCGFASPGYFTRVFTKLAGVGPKKWALNERGEIRTRT